MCRLLLADGHELLTYHHLESTQPKHRGQPVVLFSNDLRFIEDAEELRKLYDQYYSTEKGRKESTESSSHWGSASPSDQRHRECRATSSSLDKGKRNGRRDESATMEDQSVPVEGVCNPVEGSPSLRFSPLKMAKTGNVTMAKDPQERIQADRSP